MGQHPLQTGSSIPSNAGPGCYFPLGVAEDDTQRPNTARTPGLRYGRSVVGKHIFRMRERHLAEHLAPLIRSKAVGAAKLDIVLRGVALQEQHAGGRAVGTVLPRYSWEELHDLARSARALGTTPPELDAPPEVVRLKRKWVGEQLRRLEGMNLIRRELRPGERPALVVLRDDGSGKALDDPDGTAGKSYVSILGTVISSGALARWGAAELSFYLAAMIGERHAAAANKDGDGGGQLGTREWFRPLGWFADKDGRFRPPEHVRIPLSVPTLERGLVKLRRDGLVTRRRIYRHPRTGHRLRGPRNFYTNHFDLLDRDSRILDPEEYRREVSDDE